MSVARKCDRCGKFYEKNSVHWFYGDVDDIAHGVSIIGTGNAIEPKYDLCDSCIKDFRVFMEYYDKEVSRNGEERTERDSKIGFVGNGSNI